MSAATFCANCGADITEKCQKERHYSPAYTPAKSYCDKACRAEADRRGGFFQEMSAAGKEARSQAVAASNKAKPRRRQRKTQV